MRKVEASATGPVIEEKLAFRLAGSYHLRDGYYDDIDTKDSFSDRDRWALKGQFLWTPTDTFDARFIGDYTKMREHCCPAVQTTIGLNGVLLQGLGGVFPNPSDHDTLDVGTNSDPREDVDDWGLSLETNWDLDVAKLKMIFAHRQTDIFRTQDIDFTNVDILRPGDTDENWRNWSLEFQLGGNLDTLFDLDWLFGWYGYSEDLRNAGQVRIASQAPRYIELQVQRQLPLAFAARFRDGEGRSSVFAQDNKGWSIFTHNIFHPTDRLSFTIGARYGWERKEGSGIHNGAPVGTISSAPFCDRVTAGPATPLGQAIAQALTGLRNNLSNTCDNFSFAGAFEKRNWSGTLQLGYALTDDVNGYVSVARGYKAGGFNLDADAFNCEVFQIDNLGNPGPDPNDGTLAVLSGQSPGGGVYCYPRDRTRFGPETSYNYEFGLKSQIFDGRLTANLAVFWTDFKGFQLNQFTGLGFIIRNVPDVQARGAELEMTAYPWEGVIGNFSVTYADTRYGDDVDVCFELQRPDLSVNRCPSNVTTGGLDTGPGGSVLGNFFPRDQFADGHRITQSPAWSGSLSLSIEKPLFTTGWTWYGGGNLYYRGRHKTSSDLDPLNTQEAYTKLNVQAGFRSQGGIFDIQAWANNLTNEIVTTGYFASVFQGGSVSAFRQSPRMYGVTATYHFGE